MVCKSAPHVPLQNGIGVRQPRNHRAMLQLTVVCSSCAEETEAVVDSIEDVEREVCPCGYSYVVLAVSEFEPVYAERARVIELPRRRKLSNAA